MSCVATECAEKFKQTVSVRYPLYEEEQQASRLRSRKGFLKSASAKPPDGYPLCWNDPEGYHLEWIIWKTLDQISRGVAPVKLNKVRWRKTYYLDILYEYGKLQDMQHLLLYKLRLSACTLDYFWHIRYYIPKLCLQPQQLVSKL